MLFKIKLQLVSKAFKSESHIAASALSDPRLSVQSPVWQLQNVGESLRRKQQFLLALCLRPPFKRSHPFSSVKVAAGRSPSAGVAAGQVGYVLCVNVRFQCQQ